AIILHSCSTDRDEEVGKEKIESVKASNKIEINLNSDVLEAKNASNLVNDSIKGSVKSTSVELEQDDTEIISPGDVKPPKK
uniref:hypothetical protein n=1 Tax=Chryseobacterium indologenes TaxID=253 RepID=UPI001E5CAB1A